MYNITVIVIALLATTLALALAITVVIQAQPKAYKGPIYCIMITGKDDKRIKHARMSVQNFQEQTYVDKTLLIINHHPTLKVMQEGGQDGVYEFSIEKSGTLGDLRNIALQMVAHNACWTTWDDDDYRSPDYLRVLARYKTHDNVVCISRRLEYNGNNGASWVAEKTDGFVLFLASFDNRIKYLSQNSLEDIVILQDFKSLDYTVKVLRNDPRDYVRLIHNNNTSIYVKSNRDYLVTGQNYRERFTRSNEKTYIESILPKLLTT